MIRHIVSRCAHCAGPVRHAPGERRLWCARCRIQRSVTRAFWRLALRTLTRTA